jgi:propionyl-CoA synthetase
VIRRKKHWKSVHEQSIDFENGGAEQFWDEQAKQIVWFKQYDSVLDFKDKNKLYTSKWFEGGLTNTCYNALDVRIFLVLKI